MSCTPNESSQDSYTMLELKNEGDRVVESKETRRHVLLSAVDPEDRYFDSGRDTPEELVRKDELERLAEVSERAITVDIHLKDGTVRTYKTFRLRGNRHETTFTEEFDGAAFNEAVDHITALEDGSLEFHFYGGRAERWKR